MFAGDQANVVFTLIGELLFTFTYQRSKPLTRSRGKGAYERILESHTVSRVSALSNEYSIFSSQEGMSDLK